MSPEELDEARAKEAERLWSSGDPNDPTIPDIATVAARLAREGWTPPEPVVDPDILAFREWFSDGNPAPSMRILIDRGHYDNDRYARAYLAGARMAREQERERANHPIAFAVRVMAGVFKDLDHAKREARAALAKYRGEA